MAKNMFKLSFWTPTKVRTIAETADTIITLLYVLKEVDPVFSKFTYADLNIKSVNFDLDELTFDKAVAQLAEAILRSDKADIKKYEKVADPSVDFSRSLGFQILLIFKKEGKKCFSMTGNISCALSPELAIENFPYKNSVYDFEWYFSILKSGNNFFNPLYSGVKIILGQFLDLHVPLNIKYPLGWINYFSYESKIEIPSDLGFEVIKEEKGQYVIVTRDDFTTNKEDFFLIRDKLMAGMKKIKETSAEYTYN